MVAFRVSINGKPYCETEDITAITLVAELMNRRNRDRVTLHASSADDRTLQWLNAQLGVGDEIQVRIIDASEIVDSSPTGCNFCGRSIHELENLVQGTDVAICNHCVTAFAATVKNGTHLPLGASIRDDSERSCGFCRKQPGDVPGVVVRNGAAICPECLRACSDIIGSP